MTTTFSGIASASGGACGGRVRAVRSGFGAEGAEFGTLLATGLLCWNGLSMEEGVGVCSHGDAR
jgi:hypothetical protein